jgi:SET domain
MAHLPIPSLIWLAVLAGAFVVLTPSSSSCFVFLSPAPHFTPKSKSGLSAKATKKKKAGPTSAAGIKGFGAPSIGGSSTFETDRSVAARAFYDYLEKGGAGDNWKRCGLGFFDLANGISLRGVVALRDVKKGDVIIRIPYDLAVNLGQEGGDPTLPAVALLKDYCQVLSGEEGAESSRKAYYEMLPPFRGDDCLGSTDFFSEEALEALQSPTIVDETKKRRERIKNRFEQDIATDNNFPPWIDDSPVTEEHLQWVVWLITSRVLTVQGDANEGNSYRLLIPLLDMCNHDRKSPHVLSGRAVPGGELKVVAGAPVKAGEQINICYGGGVAGNDRFLQDYGFLDSDVAAYEMVAAQLLGKRRILEGAGAGRIMAETDREVALKTLRSTTIGDDRSLLDSVQVLDSGMRSALEFRLGVKQALSKQIEMQ